MKTYKRLYEKICDRENIKKAIKRASKKKTWRKDVQEIIDPENMELHVEAIHRLLVTETYIPSVPQKKEIVERGKRRTIYKTKFKYDQIIHHCIIQVIGPLILKSAYVYSCGSIPKRGAHKAKKRIERWLLKDRKNTKYICKMDIKHFYGSVEHDVIKSALSRRFKDKKLLRLLALIIDSCDEGIPLGYYTSQWFANFLLEGLDHYIKETLRPTYYIRYMDDMVIWGRNKKELHKARKAIEEYLHKYLNLRMKENWQVFRYEYTAKNGKTRGRFLDFMGFRFYRDRTTLRRTIMLQATRKARRISKRKKIHWKQAAAMLSYMGWIYCTDTYSMYLIQMKPYINVRDLKRIISKKMKGERRKGGSICKKNRNAGGKAKRS